MASDSARGDVEKLDPINGIESGKDEPSPTLSYTPAEERALVWKQDRLIVPLAATIYLLCFLDRSNIGNARLLNSSAGNDMQSEIHATQYQFNIALMAFLLGYAFFEVPSNILLKQLRPSRWLAFLMFSWGAITMGLGGVQSFPSTAGVRFLLGVFEAGLFPGLVYYLTFWYKSDERSVRIAFILASATLAGAFGGAIAYGIGHMNGAQGLSGWRWLFLIEGAPSCLSALAVWFFLPDYPDACGILNERDKEIAAARLHIEGSKSHHKSMTWKDAKSTLTDWRLYGHYLVYFGVSVPFSSLSLFSPTITAGLGYKDLTAQLMTVPPYAVAYVVTVFSAWAVDHYSVRLVGVAVLALIGAIGFLTSGLLSPDAYLPRYGCLILAASGAFGCVPPLLGSLTSNIHSTASVGLAVAINVGFGAGIGQIIGVFIFPSEESKRGFPTGHFTNAGFLFGVAAGSIALRVYYGMANRALLRRQQAGEEVRFFKL